MKNPWVIVTSETLPAQTPAASIPPLDPAELAANDFAGWSLIELNDFVRRHERELRSLGLSARNWLVVDARGLATDRCFVLDQVYDPADPATGLYNSRAAAVPCTYVLDMLVALATRTAPFEHWAHTPGGVRHDGAYEWVGEEEAPERAVGREDRARAALKMMRELGYVD